MIALLGAVTTCKETVYRDRPLFQSPPAGAGNFVGYSDEADRIVACGNCHVDHQGKWDETAHSRAWATLQNSGRAQASCEGCHSVNDRGNTVETSEVGYTSTHDPRYRDVQCESCHGPGLTHVQTPDASTPPLATLAVGADLSSGCGECHSGLHHPFVEEWSESPHGQVLASPAGRAECRGCHTAQGALAAWGVTGNYVEKSSTTHLPIVCGVCHDPHSNRVSRDPDGGEPGTPTFHSGGQLRYAANVPNEEQNLCLKCHHKRSQPELDANQTSRGPHSPEGPLLLGENVGFWFGDTPFAADQIVGTHGSEGNPGLCATCHMVRYTVTDAVTNQFQLAVVGHRFVATPCANAQNVPTSPATDNCPRTPAARSYLGCVGCHTNETVAASLDTSAFLDIRADAAQLKALVDQVRSTQINANDRVWTVAEGADFNYQLAIRDGSHVHNPFLIRALLQVSMREMRARYGLASLSPAALKPAFDRYYSSARTAAAARAGSRGNYALTW